MYVSTLPIGLLGSERLKLTIYCTDWGIIFSCLTCYNIMLLF